MKIKIYITVLAIFLSLNGLLGCGGGGSASAPITPAQIPTTISMAVDEYGDGGFIYQLGKTYTGAFDSDCTNCDIIFTDPDSGEAVTDNSCGTAGISADGLTLTLTAPNNWSNASATCDFSANDEDGNPLDLNTGSDDSEASAALTAHEDVSVDVVNNNFSTVIESGIILSATDPDMVKIGTKYHACYLDLTSGNIVYATSTNGVTFTAQTSFSEPTLTFGACNIEAEPVSFGIQVAIILMGTTNQNAKIARAVISQDGGATFGSSFQVHTIGNPGLTSFPFKMNSDGIMFGITSSSADDTAGIDITAFDNDEVLATQLFADGTTGGIRRILVSGSSVYAFYMDNRHETNASYYNLLATAFTYNSTSKTFTEGNTYRLSTSSDATTIISELNVTMNGDGKLLAFWPNPDTGVGVLSEIDPSKDPGDSTAITEYTIDQNMTNVSPPYVSLADNYHLIYVTTGWHIWYKVSEVDSAGTRTWSTAQEIPISDLDLTDVDSGSVYFDSAGRFYYIHSLTSTQDVSLLSFYYGD